jgi:ketosteroid isomerase-like protein
LHALRQWPKIKSGIEDEADEAAVIIMVKAMQRSTSRIIQLMFAQFLRFKDGRIMELREFMDSFDAVEQVLGHEIEL